MLFQKRRMVGFPCGVLINTSAYPPGIIAKEVAYELIVNRLASNINVYFEYYAVFNRHSCNEY